MRKPTLLIAVLFLAASAQAFDLGSKAPEKLNDDHVLTRMAFDDREGGETIASAILIPTLPYNDSGATCDNVDDYDEVCPYSDSDSPDVVYRYTPATNQLLFVDLCESEYDTKVYIYEDNTSNLVACNDDYYFEAPCYVYSSYVGDVPVDVGHDYYIVIDGYGGDCGDYYMDVWATSNCYVECPPDGLLEGEPLLEDEYEDTYNGGCNSIPYGSGEQKWQWLHAIDGNCLTLCGRSGWYSYEMSGFRDTDWFLVRATGDQIVAILDAEYPTYLFELYDDGTCTMTDVLQMQEAICGTPTTMTIPTIPGQIYQLWVGPTGFSGPVYNYNYTLALCGITALDQPQPVFQPDPAFFPAVNLGDVIGIRADVVNAGAYSDFGSIYMSFPSFTDPGDHVAMAGWATNLGGVDILPAGSMVPDVNCNVMEAGYLSAATMPLPWTVGRTGYMTLHVRPPLPGPFTFQLRSGLHIQGGPPCAYVNGIPQTGTYAYDEQGYEVMQYTIDVIYDQDKLRTDQMLYYNDYNGNTFHDATEPCSDLEIGYPDQAPDNSCWLASASNMMLFETGTSPYRTALCAGGANSPEHFPWGGMSTANGTGVAFTFDDGGFQHWLFAREGIGWEGPIITDEQFAAHAWSIDPVAWTAAQIGMDHPVGIAFYWGRGDRQAGDLPTGFYRDRVSGYHAVTVWGIDTVGETITLADSDDGEAIYRVLPYEWADGDWYIPAGAYHAQALYINYAVSSRGETPVMADDFRYTQEENGVRFNWRSSDLTLFKVTAERGAESWQLEAREIASGQFEALDRTTNYLEGGEIHYRLFGQTDGGAWELLGEHTVQVSGQAALTPRIAAYPNPFNPSTLVEFSVPADENYRIFVADITGRRLAVLDEGVSTGESASFVWRGIDEEGRRLSSGVYFLVLETRGGSESRKIVLLQ